MMRTEGTFNCAEEGRLTEAISLSCRWGWHIAHRWKDWLLKSPSMVTPRKSRYLDVKSSKWVDCGECPWLAFYVTSPVPTPSCFMLCLLFFYCYIKVQLTIHLTWAWSVQLPSGVIRKALKSGWTFLSTKTKCMLKTQAEQAWKKIREIQGQ